MSTRDPTQHVYRAGVRKTSRYLIGQNLKQCVCADVFIVINVGFNENTIRSVNSLHVALVKGKLNVRLSELQLFVTTCGPGMKESWPYFCGKCPLCGSYSYLVQ